MRWRATAVSRSALQRTTFIAATESINNMAGQFARQEGVGDKALRTIRMRWQCPRTNATTSPSSCFLVNQTVIVGQDAPTNEIDALRGEFTDAG
jgi:hypothetical protein